MLGSENSPSIKLFLEVKMSSQTNDLSAEKLQKILGKQGFEMTLEEARECGEWLVDPYEIISGKKYVVDMPGVEDT
jgi:hypothetical protein